MSRRSQPHEELGGREFEVERTASAKALGKEQAWCLFKKYLFIWLLHVLVAAFGTFSCRIWDPVPTRPLRWERGILVTGPSGKSQAWCLEGKKPV